MPAAASTELMRACKHTGILATNLQYARQNKTVLLHVVHWLQDQRDTTCLVACWGIVGCSGPLVSAAAPISSDHLQESCSRRKQQAQRPVKHFVARLHR